MLLFLLVHVPLHLSKVQQLVALLHLRGQLLPQHLPQLVLLLLVPSVNLCYVRSGLLEESLDLGLPLPVAGLHVLVVVLFEGLHFSCLPRRHMAYGLLLPLFLLDDGFLPESVSFNIVALLLCLQHFIMEATENLFELGAQGETGLISHAVIKL